MHTMYRDDCSFNIKYLKFKKGHNYNYEGEDNPAPFA